MREKASVIFDGKIEICWFAREQNIPFFRDLPRHVDCGHWICAPCLWADRGASN